MLSSMQGLQKDKSEKKSLHKCFNNFIPYLMPGMKPVSSDGNMGLGEEGTGTGGGIASLQEQFSVPLFWIHLSLAHHFADPFALAS